MSKRLIYAEDAIDALAEIARKNFNLSDEFNHYLAGLLDADTEIRRLPSAQPEQRYTEEELRVFAHGISLSLLSKRSAQHWQYDKDTATEIEFLERLYDKVCADMKGGQG